MQLDIIDSKKPLDVADEVFGREFREDLVHQVVVAYRNAGRAGTKAQKTRSEVRGTTKKFKKQKGGPAMAIIGSVSFAGRDLRASRAVCGNGQQNMYRARCLDPLGVGRRIDSVYTRSTSTRLRRATVSKMRIWPTAAPSSAPSRSDNLFLASRRPARYHGVRRGSHGSGSLSLDQC